MGEYILSEAEKASYDMPSKKEMEYLSRLTVNKNIDCLEVIYVNSGSELLLNEDPARYGCQKCNGYCGKCDHTQFGESL